MRHVVHLCLGRGVVHRASVTLMVSFSKVWSLITDGSNLNSSTIGPKGPSHEPHWSYPDNTGPSYQLQNKRNLACPQRSILSLCHRLVSRREKSKKSPTLALYGTFGFVSFVVDLLLRLAHHPKPPATATSEQRQHC